MRKEKYRVKRGSLQFVYLEKIQGVYNQIISPTQISRDTIFQREREQQGRSVRWESPVVVSHVIMSKLNRHRSTIVLFAGISLLAVRPFAEDVYSSHVS